MTSSKSSIEKQLRQDLESKGSIDEIESRAQKTDSTKSNFSLGASEEKLLQSSKKRYKLLNNAFSLKEVLDRLGYGFGAHQWVTIFFFLSGAGALLVGVVNSIRDVIGDFLSAFINEYSRVKTLSKNLLSFAGIFFGFSFLGIVLAIRLHSTSIYVISVILGSLGIVTYGQLYTQLLDQQIQQEKKVKFLKEIAHYGLLITSFAFLASGWILEQFPEGTKILFAGFEIPITGYFLIFELTAIMFILSGFILSNLPTKTINPRSYSFKEFTSNYFREMRTNRRIFAKHKLIKILFTASLLVSVLQSLGASFYGYYIYKMFKNYYFGGFLNVAIIFSVAILASFLGMAITKRVQRKSGLAPMFVFGTLLLALMPLVLLFNKSFYPVMVGAALAIIGSSIVGVAQGLLTRKLLSLSERKAFYQSLRSFSAIPFLIMVAMGAFIAQYYSFELVFKITIVILVVVVMPIYFGLVLKSNRRRSF